MGDPNYHCQKADAQLCDRPSFSLTNIGRHEKLLVFITITVVCTTIVLSLYFIKETGKDISETAVNIADKINSLTYERLIEIKEYFGQAKSAKGDELIVAEVTHETEYVISDTKREFWTSLLFKNGISLGTNIVKIRCPTVHKYFIRISDPSLGAKSYRWNYICQTADNQTIASSVHLIRSYGS